MFNENDNKYTNINNMQNSIMDVVETTKMGTQELIDQQLTDYVPKQDSAMMQQVVNPNSQISDLKKFMVPRKPRMIIREFNKKIGRNDPCPCGSGKKYKNCCLSSGEYENKIELTKEQEMKVRYHEAQPHEFKNSL